MTQQKENMLTVLMDAPTRLNKFFDACTCGRADKAAITSIKKQLEAKDGAIERLEEEIRRKDTEKDNLIHMQKDLQAQIEEIRLLLESHAADADQRAGVDGMSEDAAAALMQRRARGIFGRKKVAAVKQKHRDHRAVVQLQSRTRGLVQRKSVSRLAEQGALPGQPRVEAEKRHDRFLTKVQANARGKSARRLVGERAQAGLLPGQRRGERPPIGGAAASMPPAPLTPPAAAPQPAPQPAFQPVGGGGTGSAAALAALDDEAELLGPGLSEEGASSYFDENESVDSDYDYGDDAFSRLGNELLAGKLKLAKVYGQEEPPAAEDELEWEVRYFVLYDSRRIIHHDDMLDGLPVGERGLIDLNNVSAIEKVLGVNTFVMKGAGKVYLFKLEPHDEVMMRTWIGAISQECAR